MPSMFGGDSSHPAYKPRELDPNEELVGTTLFTVRHGELYAENVDGSGYRASPGEAWPPKLAAYRDALAAGRDGRAKWSAPVVSGG